MNHDSYAPDYIRGILQSVKTIALVGASSNEVRPSYFVMKYLLDKGYDVIPVNPGLAGQNASRPDRLWHAEGHSEARRHGRHLPQLRGCRPDHRRGPVARSPRPKVIWMQLSVRNDDAASRAEAAGLQVVMNRCPKMEYGKLSGEWAWVGGNSGIISSRKQTLARERQDAEPGTGPEDLLTHRLARIRDVVHRQGLSKFREALR